MGKPGLFLLGAVPGLASGVLWFRVGETLDGYAGNFVAWFVLPLVVPLVIAGTCLLKNSSRETLIRGLVFVGVYYGFHWIPMVLVLLYFAVFGVRM